MTPADIRAARKSLGWSQQRLADVLEVDRSDLSKIETGARSPPPRFVALLQRIVQERLTGG